MTNKLMPNYRMRRLVVALIVSIISLSGVAVGLYQEQSSNVDGPSKPVQLKNIDPSDDTLAVNALKELAVKGRAPKTNYSRSQFGSGWAQTSGCDMRNIILLRDLSQTTSDESCKVLTGVLKDPYTGASIDFKRGAGTSDKVQIDHVVALSNAWQTGAQLLEPSQRQALANDPVNLLAVDGQANQQKSDADAATWLPPNKPFRCQYVARQVVVKKLYSLWVTPAEKEAITRVLSSCPAQPLPVK